MTRVNKDLRFSKDKTPYKNYVLVVFNKNAPQPNTAGYFLHIEPDNCMIGGGVWQTSPGYLKQIRQEINGIIPSGLQGQNNKKKFVDFYEANDPKIELLKM